MGSKRVVSGFFEFIQQYGVLPLAIGVVIGGAVNDLVQRIVSGLISPLISLISPSTSLSAWQITVRSSVFKPGLVIDGLINFFSVALVIYVFVRVVLRQELPKKKE